MPLIISSAPLWPFAPENSAASHRTHLAAYSPARSTPRRSCPGRSPQRNQQFVQRISSLRLFKLASFPLDRLTVRLFFLLLTLFYEPVIDRVQAIFPSMPCGECLTRAIARNTPNDRAR